MAKTLSLPQKEIAFQLALHVLVFIFYSFDRNQPRIADYHFAFFLNYTIAAAIINYWVLPRFFYQKKYVLFAALIIGVAALAMGIEERVLEPIYFQGDRADNFPGVLFTLTQILPVITILVGFKFAWDAIIKQRELEELKATVHESELRFLKSQINPHFLFNNLNNLYSYAIENSPKTPTIILELSSVLRYMLYECREEFVPLAKEMEQLKNFTRLNELQIEERGEVRFETSNISSDYEIAPLILTVFIENAFKHSQASQSEGILIDINVTVSAAGELLFVCRNNFQSVANNENLSKGIGLENVQRRLQLIYPDAHELRFQQNDQEYKVELSIQLKKR